MQRSVPYNDETHPPGGIAAYRTVQDILNNDINFEFEPRLAGSGAVGVGRPKALISTN